MSAHAIRDLDCHPADFDTGLELGWDHARFRVTPPAAQLCAASPVYQGYQAGRTAFGQRTRQPTRFVRKWLQLRLNAWLHGRAFEDLQVTPNLLQQIDVAWCPITRTPLTHQTGEPSDASVDRVRNDAGYAAGNLAVMSARASQAKAGYAHDDALAFACRIEAGGLGAIDGLGAPEWARLATLMSYVTELPHAQALTLPLLVLPPNRLRLLNPIQALQALLTLQLARPGWSARIARIERLVPGKALRHDLRRFFTALLPRVLEASGDAQQRRWALEDAWRNALVNTCWQRFARQLDAAQAEALLARIAARIEVGTRIGVLNREQAVDGWALESGGHVAGAVRGQPMATGLSNADGSRATLSSASKHDIEQPAPRRGQPGQRVLPSAHPAAPLRSSPRSTLRAPRGSAGCDAAGRPQQAALDLVLH